MPNLIAITAVKQRESDGTPSVELYALADDGSAWRAYPQSWTESTEWSKVVQPLTEPTA